LTGSFDAQHKPCALVRFRDGIAARLRQKAADVDSSPSRNVATLACASLMERAETRTGRRHEDVR